MSQISPKILRNILRWWFFVYISKPHFDSSFPKGLSHIFSQYQAVSVSADVALPQGKSLQVKSAIITVRVSSRITHLSSIHNGDPVKGAETWMEQNNAFFNRLVQNQHTD